MQVGLIGLGRMGYNVALNLIDKKFRVVAYNRSPQKIHLLAKQGATPAFSLQELCAKLKKPRVVMLFVPAGKPVDQMIEKILPCLSRGDVVIDAGNSFYLDSIRRFKHLKKRGVNFIDEGTSGGLSGARYGACLTIGGEKKIFKKYEKLFKAIAMKNGYAYVGPPGAGHFVKMVHNGIEYGFLQAIGEGFDILHNGPYKLNYAEVSRVWSNGSIIRAYLLELAEKAFRKDAKLKKIKGVIGGGETGTWTYNVAKKEKVPVPVLQAALKARKASSKRPRFAGQVIAAVRNEFGGHAVVKT